MNLISQITNLFKNAEVAEVIELGDVIQMTSPSDGWTTIGLIVAVEGDLVTVSFFDDETIEFVTVQIEVEYVELICKAQDVENWLAG